MVPNPLAVLAQELGVEYESSKLAWALLERMYVLQQRITELEEGCNGHCCGCAVAADVISYKECSGE